MYGEKKTLCRALPHSATNQISLWPFDKVKGFKICHKCKPTNKNLTNVIQYST